MQTQFTYLYVSAHSIKLMSSQCFELHFILAVAPFSSSERKTKNKKFAKRRIRCREHVKCSMTRSWFGCSNFNFTNLNQIMYLSLHHDEEFRRRGTQINVDLFLFLLLSSLAFLFCSLSDVHHASKCKSVFNNDSLCGKRYAAISPLRLSSQ